jgi:methylmalonyl-CoA/ethylmalonyl-CoA epimerase
MIGKLNHIGIATPSIDESARIYRDMFGATSFSEKFAMPEQGVWVQFVNLPNSQIELVEPYGDASPVERFLIRHPRGGQHHVCFEVDDIYAARDAMQAKGATVIGTGEPKIGTHGVPMLFFHPRDLGGVLVELMETPDKGAERR